MVSRAYAILLAAWEKLVRALSANPQAGSETTRDELSQVIAEARDLTVLQGAQQAAKQKTSKELKAKIVEGSELAERLRAMTRGVYGFTNEKLVEFGLKVRRPRSPKAPAEEPAPVPTPEPQPDPEAGGKAAQ